jgi:hypothetical protein
VRKQITSVVVLCLTLPVADACRSGGPNATAIDPIQGIVDAFRTHPIVALGEGAHGNNQAAAFRLALIRDPRFTSIVNDIVVESGSARYQPVMDRYIDGQDVPPLELRRAWQDSTMPNTIWDLPIYEQFFRAVRDVNMSLPRDRRLRVLLGDPPIDWDHVHTNAELLHWVAQRDAHAHGLIQREVLAGNRRALLVYNDGHFLRRSRWKGTEGAEPPNVLTLLESSGLRVFSIWTNTTVQLERLQRSVENWHAPSLTRVRGTRLGQLDFKYFAGMETAPATTMADQFDAILYLGPVSAITFATVSSELCADTTYTTMRLTRLALQPSDNDLAEFRTQCAANGHPLEP